MARQSHRLAVTRSDQIRSTGSCFLTGVRPVGDWRKQIESVRALQDFVSHSIGAGSHTLDDLEAWLEARVGLLLFRNVGAELLPDLLGERRTVNLCGDHGGAGEWSTSVRDW